ncbi:hypothetical protein EG329_002730 [Mollisiaceae sp. DMI_Dod_QoI]|nr:hypothetical protein EG329_002730 [Helotiales sp. DMI_Dod_QoI]
MQDSSTMGGQYSYCSANNNAFVGPNLGICQSCLRENNAVFYLSNFLVALDAGCLQQPANSTVVGLNTTLFSNTQVAIITPVSSQAPTAKSHKSLSEGAIIGIVVGAVVLIIIFIAIGFICLKKRRNASRLQKLRSPLDERFGAENITAPNKGAFSSPQTSPSLHKDSIQMMQAPKVRNFSFSRPSPPQRAGEWTGVSPTATPSTTFSSSPPGYDQSPSPPNSGRSSIPAHHAYIPPEYTPPSRNSMSPLYVPPPPPQQPPHAMPASYPQRSPSASIRTTGTGAGTGATPTTSPAYIHRSSPSVSSIRTRAVAPPPVSITRNPSTASRFVRHPSISPSLINTMPSPNNQPHPIPSPNNNPYTNGNHASPGLSGGEEGGVGISPPLFKATSRFENEEEARKARERLYREGLAGRTLVHSREEEVQEGVRGSPESERSEELWPGSY